MNRLVENHLYHHLPVELQALTKNFKGRERDIVLLSSLVVLSNCLPNISGNYDDDEVYPNLYLLIVAPPASGKGVMNYSRILIERIHQKILNDSKNEKAECEESKKKNKENRKDVCPNIQVKIVPANISTSEFYSFLGNSKHGLLMMESEADTLSIMMKNDWSNYSDVLRKCFHHEYLSIARKVEDLFEEISEPKLSVLISGTPGQLKPFLKSRENGLFSRFIIYSFDEITEFKNVFAHKADNPKEVFKQIGDKVYSLYEKLASLDNPIEFSLTDNQKEKFLVRMRHIWQDISNDHTDAFLPVLMRHGLIMFRIAMILTAIRRNENIDEFKRLTCNHTDFLVALQLTQTILRHSQVIFNSMEVGILSAQDEELLDALPEKFTRQSAIDEGLKLNIPKRTVDDKLSKWQVKKVVKKIMKGLYKKI